MALEIERKFLVRVDTWKSARGTFLSQGYLCRDNNRTIRVRIAGDTAQLTIKGVSHGISRREFEYAIPVDEARELMAMCEEAPVEKIRREVIYAGMTWEVDEFLGDNAGLVIAELELESEDQRFERPNWLGEEVTGDPKYYNANLVINPYKNWAR